MAVNGSFVLVFEKVRNRFIVVFEKIWVVFGCLPVNLLTGSGH